MYSVFDPKTSEVVDLFNEFEDGKLAAETALAEYPVERGLEVKYLDPDSDESAELMKNDVFVESMSQHVFRMLFEQAGIDLDALGDKL